MFPSLAANVKENDYLTLDLEIAVQNILIFISNEKEKVHLSLKKNHLRLISQLLQAWLYRQYLVLITHM